MSAVLSRPRQRVALVAVVAAAALVSIAPPSAATPPPAPVTVMVANETEYRAAIAAANANPGSNYDIVITADFGFGGVLGGPGDVGPLLTSPAGLIIEGRGHAVTGTAAVGRRFLASTGGGTLAINHLGLDHFSNTGNGGAISSTGDVYLINSTFAWNYSQQNGGAVSGANVMASRSTFSQNLALDSGGAIYASAAVISYNNSFLSNTSSSADGGAMRAETSASAYGTDFTGNTANGGGALSTGGAATVGGSTFAGNTAGAYGGAASVALDFNVSRSTFYGNSAPAGDVVYLDTGVVRSGGSVYYNNGTAACNAATPAVSAGYNFDADGSCTDHGDGVGDIWSSADPLLAAKANNGGLTATFMPMVGSPLIDAIPTGSCGVVEQRGYAFPDGPGCDMGAVERLSPHFADTAVDSPFFFEMEWVKGSGIADGYADGGFHPTAQISRQAMAAFLYRLAGEPAFTPPASPTFNDVPASSTFYLEIEYLAQQGIAGGYPDGGYHPAAAVSRQAMAAFLRRLAGTPAFATTPTPTFVDVPSDSIFRADIEWLADSGVTLGYADGGFHPAAPVSRQAMAAFLYRFRLTLG